MAGHGKAQRDSNAYGFYDVRLKQALRREISTVDTAKADSIIKNGDDDNDATPVVEPEKKLTFFQKLFGKKDTTRKAEEVKKDDKASVTVNGKTFPVDTAGKTKKQIRQEKRAIKKLEQEREKEQDQKGY